MRLPPESITPSQTAIQLALRQHSPVVTEDIERAEMDLQSAQSIIAQRLRAVVVIPLFAVHRSSSPDSSSSTPAFGQSLGVLYLDSRRPAAFSKLDRQILDALAADAASILDNARLVVRERERQRWKSKSTLRATFSRRCCRGISRTTRTLAVAGVNLPSLSVGGDYFDVFPLTTIAPHF